MSEYIPLSIIAVADASQRRPTFEELMDAMLEGTIRKALDAIAESVRRPEG